MAYLRDENAGPNTQLIVLRCLPNLFFNSASLYVVKTKRQFIIDNCAHFVNSDNKNVRNAVITLFLNFSILFLDKNDPEGRIQIVSALSEVAQKETDEQN